MTTTSWPQVLSVAPSFGVGHLPFAGHEEIYQLGLLEAATELDIDWAVLAPLTSSVDHQGVVRALDTSSNARLLESLEAWLRSALSAREIARSLTVVLYEGRPDLLDGWCSLARTFPTVDFVFNAFSSEPGLDVPFVRSEVHQLATRLGIPKSDRVRGALARVGGSALPGNLLLTAETWQKAIVLRSFGLPVRDVWRLHSALHRHEPRSNRNSSDNTPLRVLISVNSRHLDRDMVEHLREVIGAYRRLSTQPGVLRFELPVRRGGRIDGAQLDRLKRVEIDVIRDAGPLGLDEYADRFRAVHVAWFPHVGYYRVQSSGKALDALVMGVPVLGPAGTAPARAMEAVVPGAPSYGSADEAVQLLLRLPELFPVVRSDLQASLKSLRREHSPIETVRWLVGLSRLGGGVDRATGQPADETFQHSHVSPEFVQTSRRTAVHRIRRLGWRFEEFMRGVHLLRRRMRRY